MIRILVFIFVFAVISGRHQIASARPVSQQDIVQAVARAREILQKASHAAPGPVWTTRLARMRDALANSRIAIEDIGSKIALGGQRQGHKVIIVSRDFKISDVPFGLGIDMLAQILIHESVHTIGIMDEFIATRAELISMIWGAKGPLYFSEYVPHYGLNRLLDGNLSAYRDKLKLQREIDEELKRRLAVTYRSGNKCEVLQSEVRKAVRGLF